MDFTVLRRFGAVGASIGLAILPVIAMAAAEAPPATGPGTERRFPPLKVPAGFTATLFACDPLIEYPSVIAVGPHPGSIYLARDYLTGLGTDIVRRDEVHLVEDTDGDGYADRSTLYAGGLNSIQGLCFHSGTVYAMHAPLLTALRDSDGDGVADERRDLLTGLGLSPEENPTRLHAANGVVMGHDGWLYLALGDHGLNVLRPEGDRLVLPSGGILRCRADGRDLHVFATGLRNIYDVALDEELNVFVRDNENDGGDYKIRVYHSFFGADHGYPYLYYERPEEALPPLANLGLGSSAGGLCYLEPAFPPDYRGNLFFCEWGKSVVRYRRERAGSTFAPMKELEFAAGRENDPYGFKPTDLIADRDGSLLVSDWADDQRPRRGRGRVYRIRYAAIPDPPPLIPDQPREAERARKAEAATPAGEIALLDSESYHARIEAQAALERRGPDGATTLLSAIRAGRLGIRGRLHGIWILARAGGKEATRELFELARADPDPGVRAQAVRALADLSDPMLVQHRLDARGGDPDIAVRLSGLAAADDPRVAREVILALGRLRWAGLPGWLRQNLKSPDPPMAHAALEALRRSEDRPAVLKLLDEPDTTPVRAIALHAMAGLAETSVVDGWIERLRAEPDPRRRLQYADALTRVHRKPGPLTYWGYRPAPRPASTVSWERTGAIEEALDRALADPDPGLRRATLRRMQRERVPVRQAALASWLREERDADSVAAILDSLRELPAGEARELLAEVIRERTYAVPQRLAAADLFTRGPEEPAGDRLLELTRSVEDGPVLASLLARLGKHPELPSAPFLLEKLGSPDPEVRARAVESLGEIQAVDARGPVRRLLEDKDAGVRLAAALAAGRLGAREASDTLLRLARDADPALRAASLDSLRRLQERRALPLALEALGHRETELAALEYLGELGGSESAEAVAGSAEKSRSTEALRMAIRVLSGWRDQEAVASPRRAALDRAVADVHGASGALVRWTAAGPLSSDAAPGWIDRISRPEPSPPETGAGLPSWRTSFAEGAEPRLSLDLAGEPRADSSWLAFSDAAVPEETSAQFFTSSNGPLRVWLNGSPVYENNKRREYQPDSDRFDGTLAKGMNRLVLQVSAPSAQLHLRFRPKSSSAEKERLTQMALAGTGDKAHGRKVFFDPGKAQCFKCHRIGEEGGRIGPELTGVGSRFSRIHLIESIVEPGRAIAPGFETTVVIFKDNNVLVGVKVAESETALTLGDSKGQIGVYLKSEINEARLDSTSSMPEGLERQLTEADFVDLIAFLLSLKT
jgi:putative membrane-bound dehydrogenase-like protein